MRQHGGPCRVRNPDGTRGLRCWMCRERDNARERERRPSRAGTYVRQIVDEVVVERLMRGERVDANKSEIDAAAKLRRERKASV